VRKIKRVAGDKYLRRRDCRLTTYAGAYPQGSLYSYFPALDLKRLLPHAETIEGLTRHYLEHRFDLLGSGWVQVKHGMHCRGLEGYCYETSLCVEADREGRWLQGRINASNLRESQRIWRLVDHGYSPIDWQLDFKSGYRWSESTWHKDIPHGHKPGVDIKVPWELARMQHLPQFAFAYALATAETHGTGGGIKQKEEHSAAAGVFAEPAVYVREFRNQTLDFIATNPPRFGVNWNSTMDIAIRVVNWLVVYDLFRAYGVKFDEEFEKVFTRSVYGHGLHIVSNLEWRAALRSNHYLADIGGLLFVAAYLCINPETDAWLAFAVQELIKETELQFYPDGANFEASTSYHRFSAEIVAYCTALILGSPEAKKAALEQYDHSLVKGEPRLEPSPLTFYFSNVWNEWPNSPCTSPNQTVTSLRSVTMIRDVF